MLHKEQSGMSEDFQLTPIPADAELGELLEALAPVAERPPESQFVVFRSGRERFCFPVLDVEEVLEWPLVTKSAACPPVTCSAFSISVAPLFL